MHLGQFVIDQVIVFAVNTHDPDPAGTGDAIDADSAPTYRVYEQETGTPILTGSMAKLDDSNTLGFYSEALTLSAANGFEVDKCYTVRVLAIVDTVEQAKIFTFNMVANVAGDIPAIKAKTDQLVFTKTNELDVNAQSINGATVQGDGTSGNKWRG